MQLIMKSHQETALEGLITEVVKMNTPSKLRLNTRERIGSQTISGDELN